MDRTRQWTVLTAFAVAIVLVAGWQFGVKPQNRHVSSLKEQVSSAQASNDTLASKVQMLRQQQRDLPKQQATLAAIAKQLPDNPALPTLIRQLSDIADSSGVDLVSLSPAPPAPVTASASARSTVASAPVAANAASPSSAQGASGLSQIPVVIQVSGTYFNIEQFFAALEKLPRAMRATNLTLSPGAAGGKSSATPEAGALTANINARVFMTNGSFTAPTAPTTATAGH